MLDNAWLDVQRGERVAVLGAGTMGNGIAQVFATSGSEVLLIDTFEQALERGVAEIEKNLGRMVNKQKLTGAEDPRYADLVEHLRAMGHDVQPSRGQGDANSILVEEGGLLRGAADYRYGAASAPGR